MKTTKKEQIEALQEKAYGQAIEWLATIDGPSRHARRVTATRELANDAQGLALLVLDLNGVGGEKGTGHNGRSLRLERFQSLGKGRWQASDGEAYLAAAREVVSTAADMTELVLQPVTDGEPDEAGLQCLWGAGSCFVRAEEETTKFIAAFCRRVLWAKAHKEGIIETPPPIPEGFDPVSVAEGEALAWANLLDVTG
jgi:hypothetical protein